MISGPRSRRISYTSAPATIELPSHRDAIDLFVTACQTSGTRDAVMAPLKQASTSLPASRGREW